MGGRVTPKDAVCTAQKVLATSICVVHNSFVHCNIECAAP